MSPIHPKSCQIDFSDPALRQRAKHWPKEALVRACGITGKNKPTILDATAGLGRDAYLLAASGCAVTLCERNLTIASLLKSALDSLNPTACGLSLHLVEQEASAYLATCSPEHYPKVILIDPMHPPRKKSALVKQSMRWLREQVGSDPDQTTLLARLRPYAIKRLVVKRPAHAGPIDDSRPTFSLKQSSIRFDVYMKAP